MIQKVWEGSLYRLYRLYRLAYQAFGILVCFTTLISQFSTPYLKEAPLDRLDPILVFLIFLKNQRFFLNCSSLSYIILSFLLQSYKITELEPLWISD